MLLSFVKEIFACTITLQKKYKLHQEKTYDDLSELTDLAQREDVQKCFDSNGRRLNFDTYLKKNLFSLRYEFYEKCLKKLDILNSNPVLENITTLGVGKSI